MIQFTVILIISLHHGSQHITRKRIKCGVVDEETEAWWTGGDDNEMRYSPPDVTEYGGYIWDQKVYFYPVRC